MIYYISNGELRHYGVKGMKWGVRRDRNKLMSRSVSYYSKINQYNRDLDSGKIRGDSSVAAKRRQELLNKRNKVDATVKKFLKKYQDVVVKPHFKADGYTIDYIAAFIMENRKGSEQQLHGGYIPIH